MSLRAAHAQPARAHADDVSACLRALPQSAYTRVPVLVYGEVADTLDRPARPAVDLVAQAVARYARVALWGSAEAAAHADSAGRLPPADSLFRQSALVGGVRVVVRRGGGVDWRPTTPPRTPAADSAAARLLAAAVAVARDSGDLFVADEAIRGDSLVFDLEHAYPRPGADGVLRPTAVRNPAPAFTLPVAHTSEASVLGRLPLRYPDALGTRFSGHVILQFVVDAAGRAEPSTVRDLYPEVPLAPEHEAAYGAFVAAARDAVLRGRFRPAALGGCPVRQVVQLPVAFSLRR